MHHDAGAAEGREGAGDVACMRAREGQGRCIHQFRGCDSVRCVAHQSVGEQGCCLRWDRETEREPCCFAVM